MTIRFASIKPALLAAAILLGLAVECGKAQAAPAETAIFAGGCFWCVEADFERVRGVGDAVSGFTGGRTANPEYPAKGTGHFEAVRIPFDPEVVSYRQLVDMFFRSIDPLDDGGQFCDRGPSYRSAIFVLDAAQRREAEAAKAAAEQALGQRIVTPILPAQRFWPVDAYHQDYYRSQERIPVSSVGLNVPKATAYKRYRERCGRDRRVRELWGDAAPFAG
jgi:peptide-methionine (S)-S-oxide reductase